MVDLYWDSIPYKSWNTTFSAFCRLSQIPLLLQVIPAPFKIHSSRIQCQSVPKKGFKAVGAILEDLCYRCEKWCQYTVYSSTIMSWSQMVICMWYKILFKWDIFLIIRNGQPIRHEPSIVGGAQKLSPESSIKLLAPLIPGSYPAAFEIVGWSATAGFNVNY